MGLDVKVVTAVFLTLLGVAVAMGAGNISADELSIPDISFDNLDQFSNLFGENVENGSITVTGSIVAPGDRSFTVAPTRVTVTLQEKAPVSINNIEFSAPPPLTVTLSRFHGDITVHQNTVSVTGDADVAQIGDVTANRSGDQTITMEDVTVRDVEIDTVEVEQLEFSQVRTGQIVADTGNTSKTIDLDNESVQFGNYKGSIRIGGQQRNGTGNMSAWTYSVEGLVTEVVLPESKITIG